MSAKELFEERKQENPQERVHTEGLASIFPGLQNIGPDLKDELKQQAAHGAHELAAALFGQGQTSGFVMYPRGTRDDHGNDGHGVHGDLKAQEAPQPEHPNEHQHERGGRSR